MKKKQRILMISNATSQIVAEVISPLTAAEVAEQKVFMIEVGGVGAGLGKDLYRDYKRWTKSIQSLLPTQELPEEQEEQFFTVEEAKKASNDDKEKTDITILKIQP